MSSVPQNQSELIEAITQAHAKLRTDLENIPESYTRLQGVEGNVKGTQISVCDTLAYLVGWGQLVLHWHSEKQAGRDVAMPAQGFKWNQLGLLAQHFHHEYRHHSYNDLLRAFDHTTEQILELIYSLDEYQLYGCPWYEKWTLGRMIQFNTSSPMKNMRTKVRRFKRENAIK
ncbi:hypothetical protein A3K86_03320 [Photobacterium jeanii]|uniref:ClbS/DfsB family four-helix bundle protein n=1 Tax=Photobacterium jeanii TaxID=858640 RepID=A0A178KN27_9GAMM|nr:ClbS/DfsB family four-helix bundle protein [Photobacterium jeanii]OAN17962.1 hypothetical protein A3K86_03320 [Photobacterium jeanii]PST92367.1 ClbS/DfsB family four-helix bundle protein [Photobacterium jeanii]